MSLNNNTPKIFTQYEKQSLRTPNVEDGNTVDDTAQGKIFTSDISSDDDYSVDYSANTISATANFSQTGNYYTYKIVVSYIADLSGISATVPGYYGSNLIKENDTFVIESKDYIRGIVNKVEDISVAGGPTSYVFSYTLNCTILQGDTTTIALNGGQLFKWNRQFYTDKDNFEETYPPRELSSSYDKKTGEVFFYWRNINEYSRNYYLQLRETGIVPPTNYQKFFVTGNKANPYTSIKPFVTTGGSITTVKIEDAGLACNSPRTLRFIGPGSGDVWKTVLDSKGSLEINEFEVFDAIVGTPFVLIWSRNMKEGYTDYPVPNRSSYIEGLLPLGSTTDFYLVTVAPYAGWRYKIIIVHDAATGLPINVTAPYRSSIIGTSIKTHDGVKREDFTTSINFSIGSNEATITGVIPKFLYVGSRVTTPSLPLNTVITEIVANTIKFSANALASGVVPVIIAGAGTGYNQKLRAEVKKIPENVKYYYDPIVHGSLDVGSEYAWSVSAGLDEINKLYTEWTEETYIKT